MSSSLRSPVVPSLAPAFPVSTVCGYIGRGRDYTVTALQPFGYHVTVCDHRYPMLSYEYITDTFPHSFMLQQEEHDARHVTPDE